jgi:hypothetical protein
MPGSSAFNGEVRITLTTIAQINNISTDNINSRHIQNSETNISTTAAIELIGNSIIIGTFNVDGSSILLGRTITGQNRGVIWALLIGF